VKVASGYVLVPSDRELRPGDLGVRLLLDLVLCLDDLVHGAGGRVDGPGQLDHRVLGAVYRRPASLEGPLLRTSVLEPGAMHQLRRPLLRPLARRGPP
jgi:hypothetical protein